MVSKMRFSLLLAVFCCSSAVLCQEEIGEVMRITPRRPGRLEYKSIPDESSNNRKHSISSVTVKLHLKDKPVTPAEVEDDDYVSAPAHDDFMPMRQTERHATVKKNNPPKDEDSDTGASNPETGARYLLPPEGFLESFRQNQGRYVPSVPSQNNNQQFFNATMYFNQQQQRQNQHDQQHQFQQQQLQQQQQQQLQQQQHQQEQHQQEQHQQQQQQQQQHQQNQQNQQQHQHQPQQQQQQQQYSQNSAAASQVHYVATPAPPHFAQSAFSRNNYGPNPNYLQPQASQQVQFISAPNSMQQIDSQPSSAVRYLPQPSQRVQYVSTPSPIAQFVEQPQQYVATPAPNMQFVSTPSPHDHYVSSPVNFVSTPAPVQFATGSSIFGNRVGPIIQHSNIDKQMHIDHFDNAMSGVRSPKYQQQQSPSNYFTTSTPAPLIISTTVSPLNIPNSNMDWRSQGPMSNIQQYPSDFQPTFSSVDGHNSQNVHQFQSGSNNRNNNNFQDHSASLNAMESANYVVNVVHPSSPPRSQHRFRMNRINQQRDVEKDTDVSPSFSSEQFGWKLTPRKPVTVSHSPLLADNGQQNSIVVTTYSSNSVGSNNNNNHQTVTFAPTEYHPYPDNPFLSHITIPSPATPVKTVQFQPDNNEQQNINVGYSIGFGNGIGNQDVLKAEQTIYANKYPFLNGGQGFTTASPTQIRSEVVKGVHISAIDAPDQPYFLKETSSNPREYVSNALKVNDKIRYVNDAQYGNNGSPSAYAYNLQAAPYKIAQTIKPVENNNNNLHIFSSSSNKGLSYQANTPFKWTNISPGLEINNPAHVTSLKPLMVDVPESVTPNPVLYLNNPNDVVTSSPFFLAPKENNGGGRIVQNFDHANALKNIQSIDISNVVPFSQSSVPETRGSIAHFGQSLHQYHPQQISNNQVVQQFSQDQPQISAASVRSPNAIEGFYSLKPIDQTYYKDKNVLYNIQSLKPKQLGEFDGPGFNDVRTTTYIFNRAGGEQQAYESSMHPQNVVLDMIGHSSNVDERQAPDMVYVPSETFRNTHDAEDERTSSSVRVSRTRPDGKMSTNYHHVITHPPTSIDLQGQYSDNKPLMRGYESDVYENMMNQNIGMHHLEPMPAASENSYRRTNKRHNGEEAVYEHPNEIDARPNTKLTTIEGIQVANPYNVDLKIVSDMLKGKPAVDESRLEPIREQMSRIRPIKLDTSALQDVVAKGEQVSMQIDLPENDENEKKRPREETRTTYRKKNHKEYTAPPRANKKSNKENDDSKYQHSVPNIASEQLQSSVQTVLNGHQVGAVVEQTGLRSRHRSKDIESTYESEEYENEPNVRSTGSRLNTLDEEVPKRLKQQLRQHQQQQQQQQQSDDVEVPYPLLKPPPRHASSRANSLKKNEKRPYGARHNRHLGHRHTRPKTFHETEEFEDYDFKISTDLRPPPIVGKKKKLG